MNKWKTAFFVVLGILVLSNSFWFYSAIGAGLANSFHKDKLKEKSRTIKILSSVIVNNGPGQTKKEFLTGLRRIDGDTFIVEKEDFIDYDGVRFIFVNNKLSQIKY